MRIYNNIPALQAYNSLSRTNSALQRSIAKLSTGLRINSAADDAAGLAISEKMRAQIRGLDRASANAQDGISMIQTAEGSLSETTSILQRMRELSVQAANDTLTQQDRGYIQLEIDQLKEEISRISNTTQFNKKKLLDGSASVLWSSDSLDTKLFVRGGLRQVDQFGQKNVLEGNYKVSIDALPGQAEIQKSDIFKIKHKNVISDLRMDEDRINGVKVDNLPAGDYTVQDVMTTRLVAAGQTLGVGTWVAGGATYDAGVQFAIGSNFSAGATFGGLAAGTLGRGAVLAAGSIVTAGNFAAGSQFSANATFGVNSTFVASTRLNVGSSMAAGTVFNITNAAIGNTITQTGGGVIATGSLIDSTDNWNTFAAGETFQFDGANGTSYTVISTGGSVQSLVAATGTTSITGNVRLVSPSAKVSYRFDAGITVNSRIMFTTSAISDGIFTADAEVTVGTTGATLNTRGTVGSTGATFAVVGGSTSMTVSGTGATVGANGVVLDTGATAVLGSAYTSDSVLMLRQTYLNSSSAMELASAWTLTRPTRVFNAGINPRTATVYQTFGLQLNAGSYGLNLSLTGGGSFSGTANILLEVKNVDLVSNIVTFKAVAQVLRADGTSQSFVLDDLQIKEGVGSADGARWTAFGIDGNMFKLRVNAITANGYSIGDKMTIGVNVRNAADAVSVTVSASQNTAWGGYWNSALQDMTFTLNESDVRGKDVHLRSFYLNSQNGEVYESNISLSFNNTYSAHTAIGDLATFKATYIGQTARMDTQLRDLDKFWDANGKFMLVDPQNITITQGDGSRTSITLYSTDTIGDVAKKLNTAVASGLGQAKFLDNTVDNDAGKFTTFVIKATPNTPEAVEGTFVIRSIVNGQNGILSFSGDEDLIKALSLNVIQSAKEDQFNVAIQDAHSGQKVAEQKISGNVAIGLLHPNLDFEFKTTADMSTVWNKTSLNYDTKAIGATSYETIIHVADNTAIFQIGANEGEDMSVDIADMSTRALGVHKVLVTDQKSAARSITIIDGAIDRVSSQRAKLGAYQNRLDHTISNLTIAAENLTAAESRIRDLDMAKEMMNFTKLNILMQAGNAMLGQANQLPQNVLALLR